MRATEGPLTIDEDQEFNENDAFDQVSIASKIAFVGMKRNGNRV